MGFDWLNAGQCGKKGGQAKSPAKARAARANGRLGKRKRTRTLAEYLLRRRIADYQRQCITKAFEDTRITGVARSGLLDYFRVASLNKDVPHTTAFTPPRGAIRQDVLLTVRIFRLLAASELRKLGKPKPPKDYVVEWIVRERTPQEQERWHRTHSTFPLPRRYQKQIFFRETEPYRHYNRMLSLKRDYPLPTAQQVKDEFGAQAGSEKVCQAIVDDLKAKYPR